MEAAFFDLDKTVIARASMVAFGRPLRREGLINRRLMLRALWGQLVYLQLGASEEKLARMRESVLALTKGWEQARVKELVRETLTSVVEPIIYKEALELIEEHKQAGRLVVILSASPEEIVGPVGEHLGVDRVIASRAEVGDDGRYTGVMAFYSYGPAKAVAMRDLAEELGIDLGASYAYSDSATDLPMLEAVGNPVVVNPDRELARAARQRGWEVRTFALAVRLRDRVPVPPAKPTAIGAGVVGAAVAALAWWRLRREPAPPPPPSAAARISRLAASAMPRARAPRGGRGGSASSWRRR